MNTKDVKRWLWRARGIDKEINQSLEMLEATYNRLVSATQTLNGIVVSGSHNPHRFDKIAELANDVNNKTDELVEVKAQILNVIYDVENRNQRLVLISYYLEMKTWEQTAVDMNYSWRQIMNIHGQALKEVGKILEARGINIA